MTAPHIQKGHEGRFHRNTGIPLDEPIPMSVVLAKRHSKSKAIRKQATFALLAKRGWKPLHKKD